MARPSRFEDYRWLGDKRSMVVHDLDNVTDACVRGEPHPIVGQIVTATVRLASAELPAEFRARMRSFCLGRLEPYKVPARVTLSDQPLYSQRYKRVRKAGPVEESPS